jgi:hypothetical protein
MAGGFQADLDELHDVATKNLPEALDDLRSAATWLVKASDDERKAFTSRAPDLRLPALRGWQSTVDAMIDLLREDHENLDLGRQALLEVARRYGSTEDGNADSFRPGKV